jgi:hypothetical protein
MKGKHTQGNWRIVSQMPNGYTIENEQGKLICFSQCEDEDGEHTDEDMANLALIKAAPEMLILIRDLKRSIERLTQDNISQEAKDLEAYWIGEANELLNEISK